MFRIRYTDVYKRQAVHLHYVEGYSTEEIASALDCRPATARTWLFRARARIRELMEADAAEGAPATLPNLSLIHI